MQFLSISLRNFRVISETGLDSLCNINANLLSCLQSEGSVMMVRGARFTALYYRIVSLVTSTLIRGRFSRVV